MSKIFRVSIIITLLGLLLIYYATGSFELLWIGILLSVLEVSLSFDNAILNARVLEGMSPLWRKRFLTWGILIAVFGMRLIFPVMIVWLSSGHSLGEVLYIALYDVPAYGAMVEESFHVIAAFGGGFLLMLGYRFFNNVDANHSWCQPIEKIVRLGHRHPHHNLIFVLGVSVMMGLLSTLAVCVLTAFGMLLQWGMHALADNAEKALLSNPAVRTGLMSFLYLEVLDASFSFDGVVGAFAMTNHLVVIMVGLGIGAFFVRSITIYLVEHQTIARFKYLEHGAHHAVLTLGICMLLKIFFHIPEWFIGFASIAWIGAAIIQSRKEALSH